MKTCTKCQNEFEITASDLKFYEKISVPGPKKCPDCRLTNRLLFRNEYNFFYDNCASCEKSIITTYNPVLNFVIYCNDCWWSDKWDPKDYGVEFDFNKTFTEQFSELMKRVPKQRA